MYARQTNDAELATESVAAVENAEQELPTFKWNEEAADFLLDAYHMRRHLFRDPQIRKKDLWIDILHEMQANGFEVADEQALDRKMRNFKITYKSVKDMMRRGQNSKWRYLPKLDEIFSSDSIVEHSLKWSPKESTEKPPTKKKRPSNRIQKKQVIVEESKWDEKTVNFLLDAYHKRKDLFCAPKARKKLLWCEILQEMRVAGFQVEHKEALDRKMRNLKKTFRMLKERISIGGGQTRWPYIDKMDAIFPDDSSINYDPSISLIESSEETTFVDKSASSMVASPNTSSNQEPPTEIIASSTEIVDLSAEIMGLSNSVNRMRKKQLIVEEHKEKARGGMHDTLKESKILLKERNYLLKQLNVPAQDSDELDEFPCKTSDFTFEFINTMSEALNSEIHVKNEPTECEEIDDYNNESSCGEIRLNFSGTFVLVCGFCHEKHKSLIDFGLHLKKRHEGHLKSTIAVECLDTTKVEDVESVYVTQYDTGYKHGEQKSSKTCNNCGKSFIYIENFRSHECERASGNLTKTKTFAESMERNNVSETVNETFAESIDELPAVPSLVKSEHEDNNLSANETQAKDTNRKDKTLPIDFNPQTRQCKFCGQEFETKAQCTKHEYAHFGEKPYSCWYCQQTFRTQSSRDYHVRMHTGQRPFKCSECFMIFAQRQTRDRHTRQHHKGQQEVSCRICGKVFSCKSNLRHHVRQHNLPPRICEHCGKIFKSTFRLNIHLKKHTGVPDCICVECGKGFYSKQSLQNHMNIHSNQKPFECEVCGRKFARYPSLFVHLKLHSEEKPHACNICGNAYVSRGSLHAHMRSHGVKLTTDT